MSKLPREVEEDAKCPVFLSDVLLLVRIDGSRAAVPPIAEDQRLGCTIDRGLRQGSRVHRVRPVARGAAERLLLDPGIYYFLNGEALYCFFSVYIILCFCLATVYISDIEHSLSLVVP